MQSCCQPLPSSSLHRPKNGTVCRQSLRPTIGCHQQTSPPSTSSGYPPPYWPPRSLRCRRTSRSIPGLPSPPASRHPGSMRPSSTNGGSPPRSSSFPCRQRCTMNHRTQKQPSCCHRLTRRPTSTTATSHGPSNWCPSPATRTPDRRSSPPPPLRPHRCWSKSRPRWSKGRRWSRAMKKPPPSAKSDRSLGEPKSIPHRSTHRSCRGTPRPPAPDHWSRMPRCSSCARSRAPPKWLQNQTKLESVRYRLPPPTSRRRPMRPPT